MECFGLCVLCVLAVTCQCVSSAVCVQASLPLLPTILHQSFFIHHLTTGNVSNSGLRHTTTCRFSVFEIYITFSFLIRDVIKILKINAQLHKFECTWRQVQKRLSSDSLKSVFHNLSCFKKVVHCTGHTRTLTHSLWLHSNYGNSRWDVRNEERKSESETQVLRNKTLVQGRRARPVLEKTSSVVNCSTKCGPLLETHLCHQFDKRTTERRSAATLIRAILVISCLSFFQKHN